MSDLVRIIHAAKERLFNKGWTKHTAGSPEGPNCIMGALYYGAQDIGLIAIDQKPWMSSDQKIWKDVHTVMGDTARELGYISAAQMNDRSETDFSSVLDLLDLAAKKVENV